jgi:hypothetical protein
MGPLRHNAPRGILFYRHTEKSEKLGLSSSNGDGHPTFALPSAPTRVGSRANVVDVSPGGMGWEEMTCSTRHITAGALRRNQPGASAANYAHVKPRFWNTPPRRPAYGSWPRRRPCAIRRAAVTSRPQSIR